MTQDEPMTKTESAYQILRREILEGHLAPGSQLKLSAVREKFNLGWTPLREALARLEGDRLVTAKSNKGFSVAEVSLSELQDLARSRLVLEMALMEESILKGDDTWEERVAAAHFRLSRCKLLSSDQLPVINPSNENFAEWEEKHQEFHLALLSAATSDWLKRFYLDITIHMHRHLRFLMEQPEYLRATGSGSGQQDTILVLRSMVIESHTRLMQAAIDRDLDTAKMLMVEHVQFTNDAFSEFGEGLSETS